MPPWLPAAKEIFQILFFVVVGIVTVLTFRKANKTLLQPIRTEVFKEQIKLFADVLRLFRGKGEVELRDDAGFNDHFVANTAAMYDDFARTFFDFKPKEEERPYARSKCPMSIVPEKYLLPSEVHVHDEAQIQQEGPVPDPRTRAAIWASYEPHEIRISAKMINFQKSLKNFVESPFMPRRLSELIKEYNALVDRNVMSLGKLLIDCAKEMPVKYPSIDTLRKASFAWIQNKYADGFEHLRPKADEISEFLRKYLGTENILE